MSSCLNKLVIFIALQLIACGNACTNTRNFFEFKNKFKTCNFIAKKNTSERCTEPGVQYHCPVTCGACDESTCADTPLMFKIKQQANAIVRSCEWVMRKDTQSRCALPGVKDKCPSACGTCVACDDSNGYFAIEFPKMDFNRSCEWVARQDTAVRCRLKGVKEICKQTCGQC